MPFKKQKTNELINSFNDKYGVRIDVSYLERLVENLNIDLEGLNTAQPNKVAIHDALINDIKTNYKRIFLDALNQKYEKEYRSDNPETNMDEFARDFDALIFDSIYLETAAFGYVAPSDAKYGGMDEEEFDTFISTVNFHRLNDEVYNSFNEKSTYDIQQELENKFFNKNDREAPEYRDYISTIQAVKRRYEERGFFGKLFHPIDSIRESRLIDKLAASAQKHYYKEKEDVEADIDNMIVKDSKAKDIMESIDLCKSDIANIRYEGQKYNLEKIQDAREKYKNLVEGKKNLSFEEAKKENQEKFDELYPKFKEVFEKHKGHFSTEETISHMDKDTFEIKRETKITTYLNKKDHEFLQQNLTTFYSRYKNEYQEFNDKIFPKLKEAYDNSNHNMNAVKAAYKKDHKHGMFSAMYKFENELKRLDNSPEYFDYKKFTDSVVGPELKSPVQIEVKDANLEELEKNISINEAPQTGNLKIEEEMENLKIDEEMENLKIDEEIAKGF